MNWRYKAKLTIVSEYFYPIEMVLNQLWKVSEDT